MTYAIVAIFAFNAGFIACAMWVWVIRRWNERDLREAIEEFENTSRNEHAPDWVEMN